MQEKISPDRQPSQADLFSVSSKTAPPPTSWVEENIVVFLQIKTAREILLPLIDILQDKDYARQKLKLAKLSLVSVPTQDGSAGEIADASMFNALQSQLGIQLESLRSFLQTLPSLSAGMMNFSADLKTLEKMMKKFPKLSDEDLNSLKYLIDRLVDAMKGQSIDVQKAFSAFGNSVLAKMIKANQTMVTAYDEHMDGAQKGKDGIIDIKKEISTILTFLSKNQAAKAFPNIMDLLKRYPNLSLDQQKAVQNIFGQLKEIPGFSQALADGQISLRLKEIGSDKARGEIIRLIKEWMKKDIVKMTKALSMEEMARIMQGYIDDEGFPSTESLSGPKLEDFEAIKKAFGQIKFSPEKIKDILQSFTDSMQDIENQCDANIQGMTQTIGGLTQIEGDFEQGALLGSAGAPPSSGLGSAPSDSPVVPTPPSPGGGPRPGETLPEYFARVLMEKTEQQEAALALLVAYMAFANSGGALANTLLDYASTFAAASTNYNSIWINGAAHKTYKDTTKTPPVNVDYWEMTPDQANQYIQDELSKLGADIASLQNIMKECRDEMGKLGIDPPPPEGKVDPKYANLSQGQRQQLYNDLKDKNDGASQAFAQANTLQQQLQHIHFVAWPTGTKPPDGVDPTKSCVLDPDCVAARTDPKWIEHLRTAENNLSNGETTRDGKQLGGLVPLQEDINHMANDYSNMSNNQQMNLSLTMTVMQQQWTVVATSMKTLNDMYMSVAHNIYK